MNKPAATTPIRNLGLASYEMSTSINLAQRAFRELLGTCLSHHGLTIPQWTLLGKLYSSGQIRPIQAAQLLTVKPSYIAKLLRELEQQALINTTVFADDGRGKAMCLTAKGKSLVVHVERQLAVCLNDQFDSVAEADLKIYFLMTSFIATHLQHAD